MKFDTGLSVDCGFVRFLRGHRVNRTSFFKALHDLSILNDGHRETCYCEVKTYTYTGRVFLYEQEPYHYSIKVENASGYVEYYQEKMPLSYLLQALNFTKDNEVGGKVAG